MSSDSDSFRKTVLGHYRKSGRKHLPWRSPPLKFRQTKGKLNPYHVLVSEIMLQQTQVDRVIPYYKNFLKRFPTVRSLAEARLGDVLRAWSGLGYNRRAKALHDAAKTIVAKPKPTMINHSGFPSSYEDLVALPGVGEYTAKAVRVFAYNEPEILIETNIRATFIHYFFQKRGTLRTKRGLDAEKITDTELVPLMEKSLTLNQKNPRVWYAALMDYGAHLKKTVPNPSRKSAHHAKQKPFKGSDREIRGAILRAASNGIISRRGLDMMPFEHGRIQKQLKNLTREGLVEKRGERYVLPS